MTRTATTLLTLLLLLATACGGAEGTSSTAAEDSATEDAAADVVATDDATTDAATTEAPATEAPATEDGAFEDAAADAGGGTGTVTIEHYSGTDEVPVDPETVVVMDLGVLLSMDALGITPDAFGSLGTPLPPEYEEVASNPDFAPVGTAFEPDYEAINALEPDLILVATRSSASYPEMREIAPTVDLTFPEDVDFMTGFRQRHEQLGQIFGVEDEVAQQLADLDERISELSAQTADAGNALVLLTAGTEVSAYGPGSRFGLVHDVLGFAAADESLARDEAHGEAVSFEFILDAAPDVLFVIDRSAAIGEEGAESAESILDNDLVAQTPAAQEGRIVYVDSADWYLAFNSIPGVEGMLDDAETVLG